MPTLQELMPFLQELSQQWLQLTLDNVPYAIALGASVWLLSAIVYNLRLALFKRRLANEQQARQESQTRLDSTQLELEAAQAQANTLSAQLEQSHQELTTRSEQVSSLEQRLQTSQHKLVDGFATLVEKFELIEQLPGKSDSDVAAAWERCNAIIERIGERFSNEQQAKARLQLDVQAEKIKTADKDLLASTLQTRLDKQSEQLAELERVLAEQSNLRAEVDSLKQQLATAQARHTTASTRIAELEKQASTSTVTAVPTSTPHVEVKAAEPEIIDSPIIDTVQPIVEPTPSRIEPAIETKPTTTSIDKPAAVEPEPIPAPSLKQTSSSSQSKWKNLFGNAMQQFSRFDEKLGSPSAADTEPKPDEAIQPEKPEQPAPVVETVQTAEPITRAIAEPQPAPEPPAPVKTETPKAASDKKSWKNMLGNAMQQFAKMDEKLGSPTSVTAVIEEPEEDLPAAIEPTPTPESQDNAPEKASKLGGLFGKLKKK